MLTIKQRGPTIYPQFITKQKYLPVLANVQGEAGLRYDKAISETF